MNTRILSIFGRSMMALAALALLLGMAGGKPTAAAAAPQASYIVQSSSAELAASLVEKHGGVITTRLEIINGVAANLTGQAVAALRLEKDIRAITPNGPVKSSGQGGNPETDKNKDKDKDKDKDKKKETPTSDYPEVVGADLAWAQGVTGAGVTVAVLDTGLGNNLKALTQDIHNKDGRIIAWKDFIGNARKPVDPNGHGSHVAGIIANSEKGADQNWNGVAPGVRLVGARVLDENGEGTYESVIAGLQWVVENKHRYNIRIINLSIVAPVQSPYWADPLDEAVTVAWSKGLVVIAAAGNNGPDALSVTVPGNNPYVVTVGAFTDNYTPSDWNDDYIAPFSGAGPTLDGFVKPDLVAPGAHMVSVVPQNCTLTDEYPANQLAKNYFTLAGTSQATAVVSGIAALVIAKNPGLTPNEVKLRLMTSSLPWVDPTTQLAPYSIWQQGAGRANAPDAVLSTSISGAANQGMDIQADIAGTTHYEGFSYFDDVTGTYRLYDPYGDWAGGYGAWDGGHGAWSGGDAWSGGHGAWSGGHGAWSGGYGAWSGEFGAWAGGHGAWSGEEGAWSGGHGAWSGGHGAWSGGHGAWSGGYTVWDGGHGAWSGGHGAWSGDFGDPTFVASFISGESPDVALSTATISNVIVVEPGQ